MYVRVSARLSVSGTVALASSVNTQWDGRGSKTSRPTLLLLPECDDEGIRLKDSLTFPSGKATPVVRSGRSSVWSTWRRNNLFESRYVLAVGNHWTCCCVHARPGGGDKIKPQSEVKNGHENKAIACATATMQTQFKDRKWCQQIYLPEGESWLRHYGLTSRWLDEYFNSNLIPIIRSHSWSYDFPRKPLELRGSESLSGISWQSGQGESSLFEKVVWLCDGDQVSVAMLLRKVGQLPNSHLSCRWETGEAGKPDSCVICVAENLIQ